MHAYIHTYMYIYIYDICISLSLSLSLTWQPDLQIPSGQDLFRHLLDLPLDDDRVILAEACIQKVPGHWWGKVT